MYLFGQNAMFVHIPRTGGTWVRDALYELGFGFRRRTWRGHRRWPRNHCLVPHFRQYGRQPRYLFTFVRHPVAYYASAWKWLRYSWPRAIRHNWSWHPFMAVARLYVPGRPFGSWVESVLANEPCWYTRLVESYVGPPGGEFIDYVGRTEDLQAGLSEVLRLMGVWTPESDRILASVPRRHVLADDGADYPLGLDAEVLYAERLMVERFYGERYRSRRFATLGTDLCPTWCADGERS